MKGRDEEEAADLNFVLSSDLMLYLVPAFLV